MSEMDAFDYQSYIRVAAPEVGQPQDEGFFLRLLSRYEADRHWPDYVFPNKGLSSRMSPFWMYMAGAAVGAATLRTDEFLEAARQNDQPHLEIFALTQVAVETKNPALLAEASDQWGHLLLQIGPQASDDAADLIQDIYGSISKAAAKLGSHDIFDANLLQMRPNLQPVVLAEAGEYDPAYTERAVKMFETGEIDGAFKERMEQVANIAARRGDFERAVRTMAMHPDVPAEPHSLDSILGIAALNNDLESLRNAVDQHSMGAHRYYFAVKLAQLGDNQAAEMALDTIINHMPDTPRKLGTDITALAQAIPRLNPQTGELLSRDIQQYLHGAFQNYYLAEDYVKSFYATLGIAITTGERLGIFTEESLDEVSQYIAADEEPQQHARPFFLACALQAGRQDIAFRTLSGLPEYVDHKILTAESNQALASGIIDLKQLISIENCLSEHYD